ncbi:MAG: helix-turn-helix domain-containing protein [Stenomitos rutilans HA7619-LM2]|nr:helix-turn-helix domain-containing protein [Stenomitos rutilans HA7619-LM2]MBW4469451.1 helix-turn-helix domain-containing protein [Stenomitos rutilans HA7619-LM2]
MSENTTPVTPQQLFASKFRQQVERSPYNISQLADMIGLPRSSVYAIMNAGRKVDPPELREWLKVFGCDFKDLVG